MFVHVLVLVHGRFRCFSVSLWLIRAALSLSRPAHHLEVRMAFRKFNVGIQGDGIDDYLQLQLSLVPARARPDVVSASEPFMGEKPDPLPGPTRAEFLQLLEQS